MAKRNQDVELFQRTRVILRFAVVDEDTDGEPLLDLTGLSAKWAACAQGSSGPLTASPVIDLDSLGAPSANGSTIEVLVPAVDGFNVVVTLEEGDTDLLRAGREYFHQLELYDGSGNPEVAADGAVTVNPNIVNA